MSDRHPPRSDDAVLASYTPDPTMGVGSAWDVLDYIDWMWHCQYVRGLCDSLDTAMAIFNTFGRSASAERGRSVLPYSVLGA